MDRESQTTFDPIVSYVSTSQLKVAPTSGSRFVIWMLNRVATAQVIRFIGPKLGVESLLDFCFNLLARIHFRDGDLTGLRLDYVLSDLQFDFD